MIYGIEEINNLLLNTTPDKAAEHIRRHAEHPENSLKILDGILEVRRIYAAPLAAGVPFMALFARHASAIGPPAVRGFGDTVARITRVTGLDRLAHLYTRMTGRDCGCRRRQAKLNALFPYRR